MTLGQKQKIFTKLISQFILWLFSLAACEVAFREVGRTPEQQDIYLKTGKSKTKESNHIEFLAADLVIFLNGVYIDGRGETREATELEQAFLRTCGEHWEKLCKEAGVPSDWGGRYGVKVEEYAIKLGWDSNHFGLKK